MTDHTPPTDQQLDLDGIEARATAATKGPWGFYDGDNYANVAADLQMTGRGSYSCREQIARLEDEDYWDDPAHEDDDEDRAPEQMVANAAFIAHARQDVPLLVAEVRRLRALIPQPVIVPSKDTPLSDYDFVELVAFASKVENEGFGYAFEEYPPRFEAPELAPIADDYGLLRQLYGAWEEALDEFWTRPDAEDVYDAHIDEARRRRREQRPAPAAVVSSAAAETGE